MNARRPWSALLIGVAFATSALALVDAIAATATVKLAGTSCAFVGTVGWQNGFVVPACGNVYLCKSGVGGYVPNGVLTFPTCVADRVFAGRFEP